MSNFSLTALLPGWLEIIFFIYWTFTIVLLIMDDREPSITLAWLFILIFVPLIGVFFYIFFGRDWKVVAQRKGWIQTLKRVETEEMAPIYERNAGAGERFAREWAGTIAVPVSRAITSESVSTVLPAASVELFVTGKAKFARLKEDLAGARRFIHLQYFIWEHDRLTAEIVPILLDRLAAGVEVRIMYDWIGCISFKKRELKQLAKAGAKVRADVTDLARINYRNHRKIVVIDAEIGYTGGMNVGQEYIDGGERFATWRDTHMRFTGQAVAGASRSSTHRAGSSTRRTTRTCSPRSTCRRPTRRPPRPARWSRSPRRGSKTPGARSAAHTWWPSARPRSRSGSSRRTSSPTTASTT